MPTRLPLLLQAHRLGYSRSQMGGNIAKNKNKKIKKDRGLFEGLLIDGTLLSLEDSRLLLHSSE